MTAMVASQMPHRVQRPSERNRSSRLAFGSGPDGATSLRSVPTVTATFPNEPMRRG